MKRILLLGGFGFIGTNILKYIDTFFHDKFSVIVFDKLPVHPYGLEFNCVEKAYGGDFADKELIKSILATHKFEHIFHSLSTTVPTTSNNPSFDIESNLISTVELLNLMVEFSIKNIVYISSGGAIYGESKTDRRHKESDNSFPLSSYGVVKLAVEKYLFQYSSLYNLKPLVLRLSNPYGKYHYSYKQGIINVALRSAIRSEKLVVWGNGKARKDFIYIDDFCDILFKLLKKNTTNKILNIASGQILSLNQIIDKIKELYPGFTWEYTQPNMFDVTHFELDTTEMRDCIGDYNFTEFDEGIKKTIEWEYKRNENK